MAEPSCIRKSNSRALKVLSKSPLAIACQANIKHKVDYRDPEAMRKALSDYYTSSGNLEQYHQVMADWRRWLNSQPNEVKRLARKQQPQTNGGKKKVVKTVNVEKAPVVRSKPEKTPDDEIVGHHRYPRSGKTPLQIAFRELPENRPKITLRRHNHIHDEWRRTGDYPDFPPDQVMINALRRHHTRNGTLDLFDQIMAAEAQYQEEIAEKAAARAKETGNRTARTFSRLQVIAAP